MLCTLSVQTSFFTLCDDNLKMRRNLPAETIQIGVTEVFGQVQQTYIFNQSQFTRLFSTTSNSISSRNSGNCGLLRRQNFEPNQHKIFILCFKLARFIFSAFVTREAQCKQRNIMYNSKKIETGLEKNSSKQHPLPPPPPHLPEIPGPMTPPTPRNFHSLPWGGYGYFLEPHIVQVGQNKKYKGWLEKNVVSECFLYAK